MIKIDVLYFRWLMSRFGVHDIGLTRVCEALHCNVFQRRVGRDVNRASDGESLRQEFLDDYHGADIDPYVTNAFLTGPCSWFEMLLALSEALDFLYDVGVQEQFIELIDNLGLTSVMEHTSSIFDDLDQEFVDQVTNRVDFNLFDANGVGGIFPLTNSDHPDQREVEIWDQHASYFRERLEGVMWTSTN